MNGVCYSMRGEAVVIHRVFEEDMCLNFSSLKRAIQNIKNQRALYVSEEAWRKHLAVYEDALAYLQSRLDV